MNRMVQFMQSCVTWNNTSLKMLSHLALNGSGSYMSISFRLEATTFCNMKQNYFHGLLQNDYRGGLDEKLLNNLICKGWVV